MSGFEITCVNKNQNGSIIRIGGHGWSMGIHDAVIKLISHQVKMMIHMDGNFVQIGVRGEGFESYLVIEPNGIPLHDLVDIASC